MNRATSQRVREDVSVDKFARAFAHRYAIDWSLITPAERDQIREKTAELLAYVDSTSFYATLTRPQQ